jgi:hypothetical protein
MDFRTPPHGLMGAECRSGQLALELPTTGRAWPDHTRFPHNSDGNQVGEQLQCDLASSRRILVVTGYASIECLLALMHDLRETLAAGHPDEFARVLIGVEPKLPESLRMPLEADPQGRAAADYWLNHGISSTQWRALLSTIELLDAGRLSVRSSGSQRIHAKIYVGDEAATLGSSNFTEPGLGRNLEANVRFTADSEDGRFQETVDFAENLWTLGRDYTEAFRELLSKLLRKVNWQEALARASSELLEGNWAYMASDESDGSPDLWPSQEQGVAQALWVLENVGAVLIADATGAGKTKMGAHLIRALRERNWRTGRSPSRYPVLICPPAVRDHWRSELVAVGESVDVISHGKLSLGSARERQTIVSG